MSGSPSQAGAPAGAFDTLAARVRFVLVEPSHPGNVGAAARAIKTMGFGTLVLVAPRLPDVVTHPEAQAMASGADDVLAAAEVVPNLDAALAGVQWSLALSARPREYGPPLWTPRQAARHAAEAAAGAVAGVSAEQAEGWSRIALVFGNERTGLANADVERCRAIAHIPANPQYSSLNLSQAIQVVAYELRLACLEQTGEGDTSSSSGMAHPASGGLHPAALPQDDRWASEDEIAGMLSHLEMALVRLDFLDPDNPRKLMSRLRGLFARSGLAHQEVNILRGVAKHILLRCGEEDDGT